MRSASAAAAPTKDKAPLAPNHRMSKRLKMLATSIDEQAPHRNAITYCLPGLLAIRLVGWDG